jgi:hypothetical protein
MASSRLPNILKKYTPRDKRNHGRPLQRLLDERDRNRPEMVYFPNINDNDNNKRGCRKQELLELCLNLQQINGK